MGQRLRDVVIVIPGITGSVLARHSRPVWAPTFAAATGAMTRRFAAALTADDVVAQRLLPDVVVVPGLVKVDGYTRLTDAIAARFDVRRVVAVRPADVTPANLVEFPYDWRQDNRRSARTLAAVAERALAAWRDFAAVPDARLIVIAHSMGGLVARYFLEVLDGWRETRALITLGTPFRGSLDSLGYLANGYRKLGVDLSGPMRAFPSVYQLLPTYPVIDVDGRVHRAAELPGLPNMDAALVEDGLRFHREIESAVLANDRTDPARYALLPIVGTHQPTMQSANWNGEKLTLAPEPPAGVDVFLADGRTDGDGTVGVWSASPPDQSSSFTDVFLAEKHVGLQRNPRVLETVLGRLAKTQATGLSTLRNESDVPESTHVSGISLYLDDLYLPDEPIIIRARTTEAATVSRVVAETEHVGTAKTRTVELANKAGTWQATVPRHAIGPYRVTVSARGEGAMPTPVHDLFEVAG